MRKRFVANIEISDEMMQKAASRMQNLLQLSEMTIRESRRLDDRILDLVMSEVAKRLNDEQVDPSANEIQSVISSVFTSHFGNSCEVKIDEVHDTIQPEDSSSKSKACLVE